MGTPFGTTVAYAARSPPASLLSICDVDKRVVTTVEQPVDNSGIRPANVWKGIYEGPEATRAILRRLAAGSWTVQVTGPGSTSLPFGGEKRQSPEAGPPFSRVTLWPNVRGSVCWKDARAEILIR